MGAQIFALLLAWLLANGADGFRPASVARQPLGALRAQRAESPAPQDKRAELYRLRRTYLEQAEQLAATKAQINDLEADIEPMRCEDCDESCFDYNFGYISRNTGVFTDSPVHRLAGPPPSAFELSGVTFRRELSFLLAAVFDPDREVVLAPEEELSPQAAEVRSRLARLELSNAAIWDRERKRPQVDAPLLIKVPYLVICYALDVFFDGRPIPRFWFLETVAKMPYISYVSCLHFMETLGWWRRGTNARRVHISEEYNEMIHCLTFEAMGGDARWGDRFLAQHSAILYYWILVGLFFVNPGLSYTFSELLEAHAVDTYSEFVDANEELLASLPAPKIARDYYAGKDGDFVMFDEFQTTRPRGMRRPATETLLDVMRNIRDDEMEHVATMAACQEPGVTVSAPVYDAVTAGSIVAVLALQRYFGALAEGPASEDAVDAAVGLAERFPAMAESLQALVEALRFLVPFV